MGLANLSARAVGRREGGDASDRPDKRAGLEGGNAATKAVCAGESSEETQTPGWESEQRPGSARNSEGRRSVGMKSMR